MKNEIISYLEDRWGFVKEGDSMYILETEIPGLMYQFSIIGIGGSDIWTFTNATISVVIDSDGNPINVLDNINEMYGTYRVFVFAGNPNFNKSKHTRIIEDTLGDVIRHIEGLCYFKDIIRNEKINELING